MSVATGLLLFGVPGFLLGVLVGRYSETHKETVMSLRQRARARYDTWAPFLFIAIAAVACVGVWLGTSATMQNGRDLVTNCQNANDSRAAARDLWSYIIDASKANQPHRTPQQRRQLDDFRRYIEAVYAPHDCSDLSKKYPLPDAPVVVTKQQQS